MGEFVSFATAANQLGCRLIVSYNCVPSRTDILKPKTACPIRLHAREKSAQTDTKRPRRNMNA